jgi:hypothetical protein
MQDSFVHYLEHSLISNPTLAIFVLLGLLAGSQKLSACTRRFKTTNAQTDELSSCPETKRHRTAPDSDGKSAFDAVWVAVWFIPPRKKRKTRCVPAGRGACADRSEH